MPFSFHDLDAATRSKMVTEIQADLEAKSLYLSARLTPAGSDHYPTMLLQAVEDGSDVTLATALRAPGILKLTEIKNKPSGGTTEARVPSNAPDTLAEGEFNRFYMRALCLRAIAEGRQIEVYRARESSNPRPESQQLIGTMPDPEKLLKDLRASIGTDTALGLPPGPNSGLSIKLV